MSKQESYGKKIGRPVGRKRAVVGLNLRLETESSLTEYSLKTGRSKSEIADTAISEYLSNK